MKVTSTLSFLALLCLLCVTGGCSVFEAPVVEISEVERIIREADTNGDGSLSGYEIYALIGRLREAAA